MKNIVEFINESTKYLYDKTDLSFGSVFRFILDDKTSNEKQIIDKIIKFYQDREKHGKRYGNTTQIMFNPNYNSEYKKLCDKYNHVGFIDVHNFKKPSSGDFYDAAMDFIYKFLIDNFNKEYKTDIRRDEQLLIINIDTSESPNQIYNEITFYLNTEDGDIKEIIDKANKQHQNIIKTLIKELKKY